MNIKKFSILLLTLALAACASPPSPNGHNDSQNTSGRAPHDGPPGSRKIGLQGLVSQKQDQLREVEQLLHLAPNQQIFWDDYQEKIGALVTDMARHDLHIRATDSAIANIDAKVDVVRNRLAAMEDIADAARKLYQVLDEEQRRNADHLLPATVPTLYSAEFDELPSFSEGESKGSTQRRGKGGRRGGDMGGPGGGMNGMGSGF